MRTAKSRLCARADSHASRAVRRFPRCSSPVGDGANRPLFTLLPALTRDNCACPSRRFDVRQVRCPPTHRGCLDTSSGLMSTTAGQDRRLDDVPQERVSEASLVQAARILVPCLASTLPIMVVMTIAVRGKVPFRHLELWWIAGVLAEFFIVLAWWTFRKERSRGGTGLNSLPTIRAATVVAGAAWGAALFVPQSSDNELMLLFAVFVFGASSFGMLLTASRTDLYALFEIPLFALASVALLLTHDPMLVSIAGLSLCYLGLATLVHRVVHKSVI